MKIEELKKILLKKETEYVGIPIYDVVGMALVQAEIQSLRQQINELEKDTKNE
jgi:hypothetical protein